MINKVLELTSHFKQELEGRGVYKIICKYNPNKVYIGSTFSKKGFLGRWYQHLLLLKKGVHYCKHLQSIVNKYGI